MTTSIAVVIFRCKYLEAVLDQKVVLSSGGTGLGIILQQHEELPGELLHVLLHCGQRELEQQSERHQGLGDHLERQVIVTC